MASTKGVDFRRNRGEFAASSAVLDFAMHLFSGDLKGDCEFTPIKEWERNSVGQNLENEHIQQSIHRGERTLNSRLPICV